MKSLTLTILLALSMTAPWAQAAKDKDTKTTKMEWSKEQREHMAKMHETMATCLRSNKSMKDCRAEMKTSCQEMGGEKCPMMGQHGKMWEE